MCHLHGRRGISFALCPPGTISAPHTLWFPSPDLEKSSGKLESVSLPATEAGLVRGISSPHTPCLCLSLGPTLQTLLCSFPGSLIPCSPARTQATVSMDTPDEGENLLVLTFGSLPLRRGDLPGTWHVTSACGSHEATANFSRCSARRGRGGDGRNNSIVLIGSSMC